MDYARRINILTAVRWAVFVVTYAVFVAVLYHTGQEWYTIAGAAIPLVVSAVCLPFQLYFIKKLNEDS